ncbi:Hypp4302 [Branchiostoma lanceolatum]|uniref:Hypp4302 protein n=1 Tax=Branchiostoma lanceolatum TaxID=7740 RepID=A0A8K0A8N5_BRALA|nr:Hypp4302 [Branchiostoma lanceolatum]
MCRDNMQSHVRRKRVRRGKKKGSRLAAPRPCVQWKTEGSSPACSANRHRFSQQPCLRPCQTVCAPANTTQFLMDDRFCYSIDSLNSVNSRWPEPYSPTDALNQERIPSPTRNPSHVDYIYQSPDEDARQREAFMVQDFTEVPD